MSTNQVLFSDPRMNGGTVSTIRVLGIDPSMGGTGIALLEGEPGTDGKIIEAIRHTPEGEDIGNRALDLGAFVHKYSKQHLPDVVVIETPFAGARGGVHSTRSAMTLPNYGIAVGAIITGVGLIHGHGIDFVFVPADQWCKIATRQDRYKETRVRYAAAIYGMQPEDFGAKSKAGDIADAVLLARFGLLKMRPLATRRPVV